MSLENISTPKLGRKFSENEGSEGCNNEDEYLEDALPDLVLDVKNATDNNANSLSTNLRETEAYASKIDSNKRSPTSSLDLLALVGTLHEEGRLGSSFSSDEITFDDEYLNSSNSAALAGEESEEVVTEFSTTSGALKISYVNHRKTHVIPKVINQKYRSYLSLMPEDLDETDSGNVNESIDEEDEELEGEEKEVKDKIINDFKALSYEEQRNQRLLWRQELERTETEIAELKEKLAFRTAWVGVLRRNLGLTKWRRLSERILEVKKKTSSNLQLALEEITAQQSTSLQKAKESFEILTNEIRERMESGREEIAKKITNLRLSEDREIPEEESSSDDEKRPEIPKKVETPEEIKEFFSGEDGR